MTSFDQILMKWLGGFPKGQIPIESASRIEALTNLFTIFKKEGYEKGYFTNTIKAKIVTNCLNPHHPNKKKKKIWASYVSKHLEIAFYAIYDEKVEMEENDLLASPISEEDMAVDTDTEEAIEEAVKEAPKEPKRPKVEYFSENAPKGSPTVNQIDPEMAKLLGLDNK